MKDTDPKIETIIDPAFKDDLGRIGTRYREVKLYYYSGRGICLSITTELRSQSWRSFNVFGDGNTTLLIDRGGYRPKLLRQYGERLLANADRIHAEMADWHDDAKWSESRRAEMAWQIAKVVKGEALFSIAA